MVTNEYILTKKNYKKCTSNIFMLDDKSVAIIIPDFLFLIGRGRATSG